MLKEEDPLRWRLLTEDNIIQWQRGLRALPGPARGPPTRSSIDLVGKLEWAVMIAHS